MKGRKNSDQIGEATCPEHIREEPRERKKNQKQKDRGTWIGRPGSPRTARPGLGRARCAARPGFFSLCFWVFFFFFLLSLGSFGFFFELYKVYKSSLRDSIFMCSRGKICHVRNDQTIKIKSLRLDLQAKIKSFRLEMLVNNIVW